MGDGRLAYLRVGRKHAHAQAVFRVAGDIPLDAPLVFREVCPNQGIVGAARGLFEELCSQPGLRIGSLGGHQQSAGVFVDAVYKSHVGVVGVVVGIIAQMPCNGIH